MHKRCALRPAYLGLTGGLRADSKLDSLSLWAVISQDYGSHPVATIYDVVLVPFGCLLWLWVSVFPGFVDCYSGSSCHEVEAVATEGVTPVIPTSVSQCGDLRLR